MGVSCHHCQIRRWGTVDGTRSTPNPCSSKRYFLIAAGFHAMCKNASIALPMAGSSGRVELGGTLLMLTSIERKGHRVLGHIERHSADTKKR